MPLSKTSKICITVPISSKISQLSPDHPNFFIHLKCLYHFFFLILDSSFLLLHVENVGEKKELLFTLYIIIFKKFYLSNKTSYSSLQHLKRDVKMIEIAFTTTLVLDMQRKTSFCTLEWYPRIG